MRYTCKWNRNTPSPPSDAEGDNCRLLLIVTLLEVLLMYCTKMYIFLIQLLCRIHKHFRFINTCIYIYIHYMYIYTSGIRLYICTWNLRSSSCSKCNRAQGNLVASRTLVGLHICFFFNYFALCFCRCCTKLQCVTLFCFWFCFVGGVCVCVYEWIWWGRNRCKIIVGESECMYLAGCGKAQQQKPWDFLVHRRSTIFGFATLDSRCLGQSELLKQEREEV